MQLRQKKKLILTAIACGIPLGLVIGSITGYVYNRVDELRPLFNAIVTPDSNQKVATDVFVRGAQARANGAPEDQRACEGVPMSATIFCFEGYWYAKVLAGLTSGDKVATRVPKDEKSFDWTGSSGVARDVYVTAFGLAVADAGQEPAAHKAAFPDKKDYGHMLDGWVFMRARAVGLQAASEFCALESAETKASCEFGVGRAAWFEKEGEPWVKKQAPGYMHGYNFAKNFTSQKSASELEMLKPTAIGEKIGIIDKMLWMRSPAKDEESMKLYACQGQKHPVDCVSTGTTIQ